MTDYYIRPFIELTGGGEDALDSVDGSLLKTGDGAVVINNSAAYFYTLNGNNTASESSPTVVTPDANNTSKRWGLVNPYGWGTKLEYVERGDQGAVKTQNDFTCDDSWKSDALDLSSILPAGTKAALIEVQASDDTVSNYLQFRLSGRTNIEFTINTQVANVAIYHGPVWIACDSSRRWDYRGASTFTGINLWVHGYIK